LSVFAAARRAEVSFELRLPLDVEPRPGSRRAIEEGVVCRMETGIVKWYDDSKGYGFITRDGGEEIFVHRSGIAGVGAKTLKEGARVEFEVAQGQKGRQARNVLVVPP
jgi:CspA family cold shock protein